MFSIGNQHTVGQSLGQGCAGSGCAPASGAVSGVYNSHASPIQGVQMGALPSGFNVLQPGLNRPMPVGAPAVVGQAPIGNFLISQSVPTRNPPAYNPPMPQPYQAVVVPSVMPPHNGGRPQVGANASIIDLGLMWKICEPVDFGLFRTTQCRTEPKFR